MRSVEYSLSSLEKRNEHTESYSENSLREVPSEFLIHTFNMDHMQSEIQNITNEGSIHPVQGELDNSGGIDFDFDMGPVVEG
jgi:hypothetical protein